MLAARSPIAREVFIVNDLCAFNGACCSAWPATPGSCSGLARGMTRYRCSVVNVGLSNVSFSFLYRCSKGWCGAGARPVGLVSHPADCQSGGYVREAPTSEF